MPSPNGPQFNMEEHIKALEAKEGPMKNGFTQKTREEWGKQMGVPHQWVTGIGKAEFTGSIAGHVSDEKSGKGQLMFTAESTGGGQTDSHMIPFTHPFMARGGQNAYQFQKFFGVDSKNPMAGKKWKAKGEQKYNPTTRSHSMHWSLEPHEGD